jgi:hypothetical protein
LSGPTRGCKALGNWALIVAFRSGKQNARQDWWSCRRRRDTRSITPCRCCLRNSWTSNLPAW